MPSTCGRADWAHALLRRSHGQRQRQRHSKPSSSRRASFMFATGIENSFPTIQSGKVRVDEMEKCRHYEMWQHRLRLRRRTWASASCGTGRPCTAPFLVRNRYDWSFADVTFADRSSAATSCRSSTSATSACPTGWATSRTPTFRTSSTAYARAFAERFPWVQLYTPVNEMFICATFSARYGWWNEQLTERPAFVTALKHHGQGQRPGDAGHPRRCGPTRSSSRANPRSYFHAENPAAIQAGRDHELERASSRLTSTTAGASRLGDVRVPHRQRHDARRVPLLPGASVSSTTASWATTTM